MQPPALFYPEALPERGRRPLRSARGRLGRFVMGAIVMVIFAYLLVPLVVVVGVAFNRTTALSFPPHGVSLHWFRVLVADREFRVAFSTSLKIALVVALTSGVIGTAFAIASTRRRDRTFRLTSNLAMAPVVLPGIFIGVALFSAFLVAGIQMSLRTAIAGQLIYVTPFVILVVDARLQDFDLSLEEAARVLGYSRSSTFVLITLRLIFPSVLSALLLAFATSLDEFFITYWVIGQNTTLPIYILSRLRTGIDPRMNAVATLLLLVPLAMVGGYVARQVLRRRRRSAGHA